MSIIGWVLIGLAVLYVLGFFVTARCAEYDTNDGGVRFFGALLWPILIAYTFWRVWTRQIPAILTIRRKGEVVRTYRFGKKV